MHAAASPAQQDNVKPKQGLVRSIQVLAGPSGDASSPPTPASAQAVQDEASGERDEAAEELAAQAAVAALGDDDEAPVEGPQDPRKMSEAKYLSATQLMTHRQYREAVMMFDESLEAEPDKADRYYGRGMAYKELGRDKEAVQDFTVAMALPDCSSELRYQSLMARGNCKIDIGDLAGADADFKAAQDAAEDDRHRQAAKEHRQYLTMERVRRRKAAAERQKERPVHRYDRHGSTVTIEELGPEEGTPEHEEEVAHERAEAWQEAALKQASAARGRTVSMLRDLENEQKRIREENQARLDRNAVRAARRRSVAEAARAAARTEFQKQRQQRQRAAAQPAQQVVVKERTEIPIQVVDSAADNVAGSSASTTSSNEDSRSSSRSSGSRQAGYTSESESSSQGESQGPAEPRAPIASTAAAAPATQQTSCAADGPAAAAAAQSKEDERAQGAREASAGASLQGASAATVATPKAVAPPTAVAAAAQGAAPAEGTAAAAGPAQKAAAAAAGSVEVQALLSESELEGLKSKADTLQKQGQEEQAEKEYARYLRQCPADVRVWSNRAENSCKMGRWQLALDCCNEALAVASPTHAVPAFKIHVRRGTAYHGLGRLQEALRDFEHAEAAAETAGELKAKKAIAKRMCSLLAEMEALGIQPAPSEPTALGLQASAAAAQVPLPSISVFPEREAHTVPREVDLDGAANTGKGSGGVTARAADGSSRGAGSEQGPGAAAGTAPGGLVAGGGGAGAAPSQGAALAEKKAAAEEARKRGNACYKKKLWEQAIRHYERAADLDPGCPMALSNKAAVLLQLKRWDDAEAAATEALVIDSSFTKARYRRAHAYRGRGQLHLALVDMDMVASAEPGDAAIQQEFALMKKAYEDTNADMGFPDASYSNNPLFRT